MTDLFILLVVGNQSAGKSSLIEAISGIRVPRYTGSNLIGILYEGHFD